MLHRVFVPELPAAGGVARIAGDEARHALRVKRVEPGEPVILLDGRGGWASCRVIAAGKNRGEWEFDAACDVIRRVPAIEPRVELFTAVPKGERLERMIDGLSQAGVARWSPLECERSVAEPSDARLDRVSRIAVESSKQCGRAWLMEVGPASSFADAIRGDVARVVLADATGEAWEPEPSPCRILIGPEGGWSAGELGSAERAGVRIARLGPHVMRLEIAAMAASVLAMRGATEDAGS